MSKRNIQLNNFLNKILKNCGKFKKIIDKLNYNFKTK